MNKNIPAIRFEGFSDEWELWTLDDLVTRYKELVDTPKNGYWRLGVRSFAKGTFQTYVPSGQQLKEKQLSKVVADAFIVNIVFAWEQAIAITTTDDTKAFVSHRFPQFTFAHKLIPDFFKYAMLDQRFLHHLWLSSPSGAGRNKTLSIEEMLKYEFRIPVVAEQKLIANMLSVIDDKIRLLEQKLMKCKQMKHSLMKKIFPRKGENAPCLRIKGYSGSWEQRKFSDIFYFLDNNTLSRSKLNYKHGKLQNVHYGDVLIKFEELLDVSKTILPYINDDIEIPTASINSLCDGDIIIADTAEDETVGKCTEITNIGSSTVVAGLHTIPCRPRLKFGSGFLGFYMNSIAYHDQLKPLMQGIKVTSISRSAIAETIISFPIDIDEQECIVALFRNFNSSLVLHEQEINKLNLLRKSLLQRMFV